MSTGPTTVLKAPIRVLCIDVEAPLPDLDLSPQSHEGSYQSALVFFHRGARVVGHAHLDVPLSGQVVAQRSEAAAQGNRHAADDDPPTALPRVSVVVPTTFDRVEPLERTLRSLLAQTHSDFEVIIVDNRPQAGAERAAHHERLRIDPRITIVEEPMAGISAARNRGVAAAGSEIIAFTDDDVEASPQWLASIAARFAKEPDTDCITGLVLPAELETQPQVWFEVSGGKIDQRYALMRYQVDAAKSRFLVQTRGSDGVALAPATHLYRAKFGMGANMAFRRASLEALHGFDLALGAGTPSRGGEDIVMISRLLYDGRSVTFDPSVVVHHYHRRDLESLRSQMRGYGVGYAAALVALIRHSPRHLIGIATMLTAATKVASDRSDQRIADDFPASLSRTELAGLASGPYAYLRSAWKYRTAAARKAGVARLRPRTPRDSELSIGTATHDLG